MANYAKTKKRTFKKSAKPVVVKIAKPRKSITTKVYTYYHKCAYTLNVAQVAGGDATGSITLGVGSLPNITAYASIYDMYRLNKVYVVFRPMYTSTSIANSGTLLNLIPRIYTVIDKNDNTALSISALREYTNCMVHDDKKAFSMAFIPATRDSVGLGDTDIMGNVPSNKKWIGTADTNVVFYGIKWAISAQTNSTPYDTYLQQWQVEVGMSVSFKHVH